MAFIGLLLVLSPLGSILEQEIGLALLFKFRGPRPAPQDVVIVTLDRESSRRLHLSEVPKEWPRSVHARLIDQLTALKARLIVFDIFFAKPKDPHQDQVLASSIKRAGNVILYKYLKVERHTILKGNGQSTAIDIQRLVPPIEPIARAALATACFPLPKVPVRVDYYWTFKEETDHIPTLPTLAFQAYAAKETEKLIHLIQQISPVLAASIVSLDRESGASTLPQKRLETLSSRLRQIFTKNPWLKKRLFDLIDLSDKKDRLLKGLIELYSASDSVRFLNFYGPPGTIKTIPFYRFLATQPSQDKDHYSDKTLDLKGKVVFVGLSRRFWADQKDGFYTVFSRSDGLDLSGVEILATAFSNLLEDEMLRPIGILSKCTVIIFLGLLSGFLAFSFAPSQAAITLGLIGSGYLFGAYKAFSLLGIWPLVVIPLFIQIPFAFIGATLWHYHVVKKEREAIKRAFSDFQLPDKVVNSFARDLAYLDKSNQMVHGICLVTDIESYTALSERLNPIELGQLLKQYFQCILQTVKRHEGIVCNRVGDSTLSIWASVTPSATLRQKALECALEIQQAVERFNEKHRKSMLPTRIGIHAGKLLVGGMESGQQLEFAPIGDIVNTASRIESLNKQLGTKILVSKQALNGISGFLTRELGEFILVGKFRPVVIYELINLNGDTERLKRIKRLCSVFAKALANYRNGEWKLAYEKFSQCTYILGEDGPSNFYMKLCSNLLSHPPKGKWSAVVSLNRK